MQELVNMFYGKLLYVDGEYVNSNTPYPMYELSGVRYTCRMNTVYVYASTQNIFNSILDKYEKAIKKLNNPDRPFNKCVYSENGYGLILTKSNMRVLYQDRSSIIKLVFDSTQSLADSVSYILYDPENLLNFKHNDDVHSISYNDIAGINLVTNVKIPITNIGNPLSFYFNNVWIHYTKVGNVQNIFVNLDARVYRETYEKLSPSNECYCCMQPLYDENYVMVNETNNKNISVCPLCMHAPYTPYTPYPRNHIYSIYKKIYRVSFPGKYTDLLCDVEDPVVRDILRDVHEGFQVKTTDDSEQKYLVSDKYVGVCNLAAFILHHELKVFRGKQLYLISDRKLLR